MIKPSLCRKDGKPKVRKGSRPKVEGTVPEIMRVTAQERGIRKAKQQQKRKLDAIADSASESSDAEEVAPEQGPDVRDGNEAASAATAGTAACMPSPCQQEEDAAATSMSVPPAAVPLPSPTAPAYGAAQPDLTEAAVTAFAELQAQHVPKRPCVRTRRA